MSQNSNISLSIANKIDVLNRTQSLDARYGVYDTEQEALSVMSSYGLDGRQVAVYTDKLNGKVKVFTYNAVQHSLEPISEEIDLGEYYTKSEIDPILEDKLNKVFSDLTAQTTGIISDELLINRSGQAYRITLQNLLKNAIDTEIFIAVEELPEFGIANKIYIVPSEDPEEINQFEEWMWIDDNWEFVGNVSLDLSNYFTKTEITTFLNSKVDKEAGKGLSDENYTLPEKNKLASITAIFTTALKNAYDNAVNWISTNGASILSHINSPHAPVDAQKNSDITKGEIEDKLTGIIDTHTHSYINLENVPTKTSDFENTGEGGGTVFLTEIIEGTNVEIDKTNPKRPIVNASEPKLDEPVIVSLPDGLTLGKYVNDDVLPEGMTFTEFVKSAAQSALEPTVSLTSPTTIPFNKTAISNTLNFSYVINSLGGSVESAKLEWRRGGSGNWTELTDDVNATSYLHTLTDTPFNTAAFNYRYTVTDNRGGTKTVTLNISPQSYVAPTLSGFSVGNTSRDRGNIATSISGTISRNSNLVDITGYKVQYRVNNTGSWFDLSTGTLDKSGGTISETHNNSSLIDSNRIDYRVQIIDDFQTTTKSGTAINFLYRNFLGYSTKTSLTLSEILELGNSTLSNSKSRTVNNVSAAKNYYTYYAYRAGAGDLTNVIQDGAAPVLTAFTKLADVSGTNSFGAEVTYRVYKSNADEAFTNNNLQFS